MENKEDVALEDKGLIRKNAAQQANDNAAADEDGEPQDGDEGGSAIEEEVRSCEERSNELQKRRFYFLFAAPVPSVEYKCRHIVSLSNCIILTRLH